MASSVLRTRSDKMREVFRKGWTLSSVGTCSLGVSSANRQSNPQKTRIEMMMAKSLISVRSWSTYVESSGGGGDQHGENILVNIWKCKVGCLDNEHILCR